MLPRYAGLGGFVVVCEECSVSVQALPPEADVLPAFVVLAAGAAYTVLLRVFHQRLPVFHVLCYTLFHEGYGFLSGLVLCIDSTLTHETLSFILFVLLSKMCCSTTTLHRPPR